MKLLRTFALLAALATLSPVALGAPRSVHAGAGTATLRTAAFECEESLYVTIVEGPTDTLPFVTVADGAPSGEPICNFPNAVGVSATGDAASGYRYQDACSTLTVGPLGPATEVHYVSSCSGYSLDGVVSFV